MELEFKPRGGAKRDLPSPKDMAGRFVGYGCNVLRVSRCRSRIANAGLLSSVLPPRVAARVAIEQASTSGWARYIGTHGCIVGMQPFGALPL